MLRVGGFVPFSTTDWPDHIVAVVFIQGCPWRCHYCHNRALQPRQAPANSISWPQILQLLRERIDLLDGVVFSGGEPTLDPDLGEAMGAVRALGFKCGLHTAGIYPERLKAVLPQLDWVGMDVKTEFSAYAAVTDVPESGRPALMSLQSILEAGIDVEVRTTCHPALHTPAQLQRLGATLAAMQVPRWVLQPFRATEYTPAWLGHSLQLADWMVAQGAQNMVCTGRDVQS